MAAKNVRTGITRLTGFPKVGYESLCKEGYRVRFRLLRLDTRYSNFSNPPPGRDDYVRNART